MKFNGMSEKLTREDLRSIQIGETRTFFLPNARACDTGKSVAYQYQNILGCKFSVQTDYAACSLSITRLSDKSISGDA